MACVVLASGQSKRFGTQDKLCADLCGKPVLSHVLDTAKSVGFGALFCTAKELGADDINWVENKNPELGQGHALRLGLQAVQAKGWTSCAVILGDMPLVTSSYLENMVDKFTLDQCLISVSESIRMPPGIFNQAAIDIILSQNSASGARTIFERLDLELVDLDAESAQDVDTPEDMARVTRIMKSRKT